MDTTSRPRTQTAERMKRHRQRRRQGYRTYLVDLHDSEVDHLTDEGFLAREYQNDTNQVVQALYAFLGQAIQRNQKIRKAGYVSAELGREAIDRLIELNYLGAGSRNDAASVNEAFFKFARDALRDL